MGNGVQRPTRDIEVSEGGRQACTPCGHMEGVDKGHLGIECHRRLSDTSEKGSPTISKALKKFILRRAGSSSERRGRVQGNKTSNDTAEVMGSQDNNLHR